MQVHVPAKSRQTYLTTAKLSTSIDYESRPIRNRLTAFTLSR